MPYLDQLEYKGTLYDLQDSNLKEDFEDITDVDDTNICPNATATTTNGGYLNGSTGTFGTVTSGKTYTFSANNETSLTGTVGLRISDGTSWHNQADAHLIANGRFSVTFTANYSGAISLNGYFQQDYDPVFTEIQLEEGEIATEYIPYHKRIAKDPVARSEIAEIKGTITKNLCPNATATTTNGGYLNISTGTYGAITSGKTYTFSAENETNLVKEVKISISDGVSWHDQATFTTVADGKCVVTFTANYSGDISLRAYFEQDYDPVFTEIQITEGDEVADYIEYNKITAIDYEAREALRVAEKPNPYVLSIAHQGYAGYGSPLNTLPAFIDAKTRGFDWVEFDIFMTSDRVPVVTHDEVKTTTDGTSVNIKQTTYATLLTYQFWDDADIKIPTLWEALEICNLYGLGTHIEFKGYDYTLAEIKQIMNMAKRSVMPHAFSCWSLGPLQTVRSIDETATIQVALNSMPTIEDLENSSTYENLRNLLAQKGRTVFYCDIPSGTSDDWFNDLLSLGYSFLLGANDTVAITKSHLKFAYALVSDKTVEDVLNS